MATYRAIEVACKTLARVLADAPRSGDIGGHRFEFRVVDTGEVTRGSRDGARILPYRIGVGHVVPRGRPGDAGPPPLAASVHLLVLVVADDPVTRLALAGWVLRTLHDRPVLAPGSPEAPSGDQHVFGPDERVQVEVDDMSRAEHLQLWDALGMSGSDALALPYVLTGLLLDPAAAGPAHRP